MSNKTIQKPLAAAIGAAFVTSLAATPIASADSNPFAAQQLSSGYMVADSHEGKCGEAKCGANKEETKTQEGKCGEDKANAEGKCGEGKAAPKAVEAKCGEAKCGASK